MLDACSILAFISFCLVAAEDGWTCEADGFWYENGVKSQIGDCDSKDDGDDSSKDGEAGWTCEADGFWYENGVKSQSGNCDSKDDGDDSSKDGGKISGCTPTSMGGDVPEYFTKTCISDADFGGDRCWWLYIPDAVASATDGRTVPLIVDMHGGGGCASSQWEYGSFKSLADTEAAKLGGGFAVVWPQGGPGGLWASHGTSSRYSPSSEGKDLASWNDIHFLEQLVSNVVHGTHAEKIDPERIYMSGFSLGCMMAHRFSLERSKIVAAFGCHGGELSFYPTTQAEMDADKAAYTIQPMPAYLTIGDADTAWYPGAEQSWQAWTYWNGCTSNVTNEEGDLVERVSTSCTSYTPDLETVMLVIKDGPHVPDSRASERTWSFVSKYNRSGVVAELPAKVAELIATITTTTQNEITITTTTVTAALRATNTTTSAIPISSATASPPSATASSATFLGGHISEVLVFTTFAMLTTLSRPHSR